MPQLSRIQPVPLCEAWPHEASSFTPWLARCENLQLLGDTIGMALECEAQEHAVGDFSADIVCRDLNTDRYVLTWHSQHLVKFDQEFRPPRSLATGGD